MTAQFGQWVDGAGWHARHWQVAADRIYGQVKKCYRRYKIVRVTHIMRCGTHQQLRTALQGLGLSGRLNTAFVERINLTLRQSIAALGRRTWSTAQDLPQLLVLCKKSTLIHTGRYGILRACQDKPSHCT